MRNNRSHSETRPSPHKTPERTARFNEFQNTKPNYSNMMNIIYDKLNSVTTSTKEFLSSAEKLSHYCKKTDYSTQKDLQNFECSKEKIERQLLNLVTMIFSFCSTLFYLRAQITRISSEKNLFCVEV